MSGHSPHPWEALGLTVRSRYDGTGGFLVASLLESPLPERHANARLIAAAPRLLEALRRVIEEVDDVNGWLPTSLMPGGDVYDDARAVLAELTEAPCPCDADMQCTQHPRSTKETQ